MLQKGKCLYHEQQFFVVIDFKEIVEVSIRISLPKRITGESSNPFDDITIGGIKTNSFPNVDLLSKRFRKEIYKVLEDVPYIRFSGSNGSVGVDNKEIRFTSGSLTSDNLEGKLESDKIPLSKEQINKIELDSTFLITSFLGKLGLTGQKLNITKVVRFRRVNLFPPNLIQKFNKEFVQKNNINDIKEITISRKEKINDLEANVEYNFYKGESTDGLGVKITVETIFTPISIEDLITQVSKMVDSISESMR